MCEYKYEVERLNRELSGLKQKFFEAKKREQLEKEASQQHKQPLPGALTAAAAAAVAAARAAAGSPGGTQKAAGSVPAAGAAAGQAQQQRFAGGGFSLTATS